MDSNIAHDEPETNVNITESDRICILPSYCTLSDNLQEQLKEKYPDVLEMISALQRFIEKQQFKIRKLKTKLKEKVTKDVSVQTDSQAQETAHVAKNLSEDIKEAAEMAMQTQGLVYEKTSGLYYDYNSGYYYNAELGLYYDGNTGTYMTYNPESQSYEFHSQVDAASNASEYQDEQADDYTRSKRKTKDRKNSKVITSCDMDNLMQSFNRLNIKPLRKVALEIAKAWPPCMRIIVKSTSVTRLKEGTLFIITYEGGTLGREGEHSVLIPDINISKHHLKFSFNKDTSQYQITDLGSRNGTLLNGKRISASKQESEPMEVIHGSQIQIGSTILLCHIHSGNETCGHCEPGLLQTNQADDKKTTKKLNKNEQHKSELRKLRKKFGIVSSDGNNPKLAVGYTDRAQARRQTVGSHNEHEKTQVASLDQSISSDNKGFKLLAKMGWSEGQSLGKEGTGVLNPVELVSAVGTAGIGYLCSSAVTSQPPCQAIKSNIWEKTQQRYQQLPSSLLETCEDNELE